jgi:hypothetical protein
MSFPNNVTHISYTLLYYTYKSEIGSCNRRNYTHAFFTHTSEDHCDFCCLTETWQHVKILDWWFYFTDALSRKHWCWIRFLWNIRCLSTLTVLASFGLFRRLFSKRKETKLNNLKVLFVPHFPWDEVTSGSWICRYLQPAFLYSNTPPTMDFIYDLFLLMQLYPLTRAEALTSRLSFGKD